MANGHGGGGHGGDRLYDNPADYENRFDYRHELDTGSRALENPDKLRQSLSEEEDREDHLHEMEQPAEHEVRFMAGIGKFIIPRNVDGTVANTWAAHDALVNDPRNGLAFDPEKYPNFDGIIFKKFPQIMHYPGLVKNVERFRNDQYADIFNDGSFDPGDEVYVPHIESLASALGEGLANNAWHKRLFTDGIDVDIANVEGVGAAEMYKYLLSIQSKPGFFQPLVINFRKLLGLPIRDWNLPDIADTPFSDENLAAPLVPHKAVARISDVAPLLDDPDARAVAISEQLVDTAIKLRSIDLLEELPREESLEHARRILRFLRLLEGADKDTESFLSLGSLEVQMAKKEAIGELMQIYAGQLKAAHLRDPQFVSLDAPLEDASNASGALAMAVAFHTLDGLPEHHPATQRLETKVDALPEEADMREGQAFARLLDIVELGLERASGQQVNALAPVERLQVVSKRFRSLDELDEPAREESLVHARIILRPREWFSDPAFRSLVRSDRPEDKLAVAMKLEEMADMYRNLLFEAEQATPGIMNDPTVKKATDAVGGFAQAVALFAVMAIPTSIASAQQISATEGLDLGQMQDRTRDRVLASEGGRSQEASSMEAEEQSIEAKMETIEQAMEMLEQSISHKKKRGRGGRSSRSKTGLTRSAKRRSAGDLDGDGVADKYQNKVPAAQQIRVDVKQAARREDKAARGDKMAVQGGTSGKMDGADKKLLPAEREAMKEAAKTVRVDGKQEKPNAMHGLNPAAQSEIKKLGGDLRAISEQLKTLAPPATITADSKIAPDDKTFAARSADQMQKAGSLKI